MPNVKGFGYRAAGRKGIAGRMNDTNKPNVKATKKAKKVKLGGIRPLGV